MIFVSSKLDKKRVNPIAFSLSKSRYDIWQDTEKFNGGCGFEHEYKGLTLKVQCLNPKEDKIQKLISIRGG